VGKIRSEFLFTSETPHPSFETGSHHFTCLVSYDPSRKRFFAHLLGLAAAIRFAPRVLAKFGSAAPAPTLSSTPIAVRPDARAVTRRAETV
jgi:hypothetical protein